MLAELIGNSHAIVALREDVSRLLQRQAGGRSLPPILILGETGTGKGLLAGAIHRAGPRRDGPFVAVNCAAIPDTLLEAELFGFERGAFTDARQAKPGLVQTAHRGTLFLDEIGLVPELLQGKLLTVLEERAVRRLGSTRSEPVDITVLAATSEDLERALRERRFTEALYHRLSVLTLRLPALRERGADILLLAEHFLARAVAEYNVPPRDLTPEARAALLAYPWPGNVRELSNRMERVTLLAESGRVTREMLGLPETTPVDVREAAPPQDARRLKERVGSVERDSLLEALTATGGNIARAAARLGVPPTTLRYRLRKHRLVAEPPPGESPPDLGERVPGPASPPVGETVAATVPPPRTLDACTSNGPVPAALLMGRKGESEAVQRSIVHGGVRLLTLTGPGGMDKTRLGLHAAAGVGDHFEDGVFLVPLANVNDPALVVAAIAQTIGVGATGGQGLQDAVKEYLGDKELLLVLDHFEQVPGAAPVIAELLSAAPRLKVLAMSRTALHLRGEHEFPVTPPAARDVQDPPAVDRLLLEDRCPYCGVENLPTAKFCGECATLLTRQAPTPAPAQTGQPVAPQEGEAPRLATEGPATEAERRQLTVMFCGWASPSPTTLSAPIDPDDLHEAVRDAQEACAEVIRRFEGHVAQYRGDGLLVYFGHPLAHEDDAYRAVRTGLGIVEAMGRVNRGLDRERGLRLAVRLGIHTGVVVVGKMGGEGRREHVALGDAPQLATQLQRLAGPDTVVISPATASLVEGYFVCQPLASRTSEDSLPIPVYRVLHESAAQSRLDVAVTKGLTPLVGREQEVGLLLERWEQAKEGRGQVVLLSGEAGIGKSRLVRVLKERIAGQAHARLEYRCSAYHQNSALYPVTEHLQRLLQFRHGDASEEKLHKLERALEKYGFALQETVPLFASLLSVPLPERYPSSMTVTPQRQKQQTLEALLGGVLKEADLWPVCLVIEDLHWVDPSTLEWLSLLIDQVPAARLLVLMTFRPLFRAPWVSRSYLTQIALSRFTRTQVEVMAERVAGSKALPGEVLHQLAAKTDGVPLFVEELIKMVLESGLLREREDRYELMRPLPLLAIPSTLYDSLMSRLDRLGQAKQVAQLGAVLGKEFSYELIRAVSSLEEVTLQQELARLIEAELLYPRGLLPHTRYVFKHALIQEAAYQSLLRNTRRQYHRQIGQVLEAQFPEIRNAQPELLAHHYTEAGLSEQAIPNWQRAGQRALERSAHAEAANHLSKGLELVKALPDTPERTLRELVFQTTLGPALMVTKGCGAAEVEETYARARELCDHVGEPSLRSRVLGGLSMFYVVRAEHQTARKLGEQLLSLGQRARSPAILLRAHATLGVSEFFLGEFALARQHVERGIALYTPRSHRARAMQNTGVLCLCYAAWTLWHLGFPDQALGKSQEAVSLAQELSHPFSLAIALVWAASVHQFCGDGGAAQQRAEAAIALCTEQGFPMYLAMGIFRRGWALAERGDVEEGIAQMRHGLAASRTTGAELTQPYFLGLLAQACGKAGEPKEGLTLLAEAFDMVEMSGERHYEAELYRLKGELVLRLSAENQAEAEASFRQALDIAGRAQAKSLELRAAMSLGRLWHRQGRRERARQRVAETYDWFAEGFHTADLVEARTLLDEL